jgi:hypothetical protein
VLPYIERNNRDVGRRQTRFKKKSAGRIRFFREAQAFAALAAEAGFFRAFRAMKSAIRGAISPRNRDPLKTP